MGSKIISFAWTAEELLAGKKTVTRRRWKDSYARQFSAGDTVRAFDKSPRFGGKQIALIRITDVYEECLREMPESDVAKEGGRWKNKKEFIEAIFLGDEKLVVWVIRFEVIKNGK